MKLDDLESDKPEDKEKLVREVYEDFREAREHRNRAEFNKSVKESDKAFLGEVFTDEQEQKLTKEGIPICKTNKGAVNSLRYASILTASRPEINCQPIGGSDVGVSTLLKRDFRKVWRNNHGNSVAFQCVLGSTKEGLSWCEVYPQRYNGLENRTCLEAVSCDMVWIDPNTTKTDLSDAGFKIKAKRITEDNAKSIYHLKDDDLYYTPKTQDDAAERGSLTHDSAPGGRYEDSPEGKGNDEKSTDWSREIWDVSYYRPLLRMETLYVVQNPMDGSIQTLDEKPKPMEGMPEIPSEEVEVTYEDLLFIHVVGKKMVEWKKNRLGRDHTGKPIDSLIPLSNIPVKKAYPRGNLFFALPALQELSKRRGQSIAIVAHTSGSPLFAAQGTLNIAEAEKKLAKPRSIIEVQGGLENVPRAAFATPPDISRIFELESRAQHDADEAWQLNPALKGEAESSKMSGRLALLLKESGLEGSSYFMVALEEFFRRIATAITAIELQFQLPTYWDRILEEEDFQKQQDPQTGEEVVTQQPLPYIMEALTKLKGKQVDIMNWDVEVQSGSSLPSSRFAQLEFFMELSKNPVHPDSPMDVEAILDLVDYPGRSDLIKRKSKVKQMGQALQQAQVATEDLQKQLQKATVDMQNTLQATEQLKLGYETKIMLLEAERDIAATEAVARTKAKYENAVKKASSE